MLPRELLVQMAITHLGTDASPNDLAPDELGCAETVNAIYKKLYGVEIGGGVSTYYLFKALREHKDFKRVDAPMPGDIAISPTGYSASKTVPNGHVGIVGFNGSIMSNDSRTGTFEQNFTLDSWKRYYIDRGRYPMQFFRRV